MLRDIHLEQADNLLEADHPRQRLLDAGAPSLSHTELISLLLESQGMGVDQPAALKMTHSLFAAVRNLRTLASCEPHELASMSGISLEQAAFLVAALELGRRVTRETFAQIQINSADIAARLMVQEYRGVKRESLRVLLLDVRKRLIRIEEVSLGGLDISIAHPREIFRPALVHSAHAIILAHNHPSGDPSPSPSDEALTRSLVGASKSLMIGLCDHIIVGATNIGEPTYYSFRENGKIRDGRTRALAKGRL